MQKAFAKSIADHQQEALEMASKAYAEYQTEPKGSEQCDKCTMFRPPSKCTYVDGKISPQGWCKQFDRK